jgi:hypothetical protein
MLARVSTDEACSTLLRSCVADMMMAWAGKWKTEMFALDQVDLDLIYK